MKFIPHPYQAYAIERVVKEKCLGLLLDMGLGKTIITLTAIQKLKYDYFDVNKVLVIAPLKVAESTWNDEVEKWDDLDLIISNVLGSTKQRIAALKRQADIYIINRENVEWLVKLYGIKWPFDMVVIDESSSFKNPSSKRFKALRKVRPLIKRIVELTGTPAPNGMMDLWSQVFLLDRGERLGKTISSYRSNYFRAGASNGHVVYRWDLRKGADKEILAKISDVCVSMKSEDYIDLPPVVTNVVKVKLSKKEMEQYKEFEKNYVLELQDTEVVALSAGVLSGKLLQLANGAIYNEDSVVSDFHKAKLDRLSEIVEDNAGKSIMVFYWYKHDLQRLKKVFPKARELKTAKDVKAWNEGKVDLLLVHPASAGHGLNLQFGGHTIVWFSLTWSLELYQQANKRLHRTGQEKRVVIHHLVTEGTIDEDVIKALETKRAGQDGMIRALKARLKEYGG